MIERHDPNAEAPGSRASNFYRFDLASKLTEALRTEVDLIVLNHAPVDPHSRVVHDGRVVINPDASRRAAFELSVRSRYPDLLPLLRICRRVPMALCHGGRRDPP